MRILVAEDERITRASLKRQLEALGHSVTQAEDGQEAWELFQSSEHDIVITDWEMPQLSGVELIARIRALEATSYVYVILLTSRSDKADIVSGIEAGADDYLSKPFDREELRVRLLAGERVVTLERALSAQNVALRKASERMRNDLEAAAHVQHAMLPSEPVVTARLDSAFVYVPTDELAGDALGLHLLDDRHLVAYVVDVAGHGVPAALLAVTAMHALSPAVTGATAEVPGPSSLVTELNRRFCLSNHDDRFLTMVLCILDTETGLLRFARAGHPLPILVRDGLLPDVSDDGGPPIGILEDAVYNEVEMQLSPGDRVFLYSDGFDEQKEPTGDAMFGEERVQQLFLPPEQTAVEQITSGAVDALAAWAGGRYFTDDVSLVGFEWRG